MSKKLNEEGLEYLVKKLSEQTKIKDNSVSTPKLQDEAVTNPKLADSSITSSKISNASIEERHLKNFIITAAKLSENSVQTSKIVDKAVTLEKLADKSVDKYKLQDNAVTKSKIVDGAVSEEKIKNKSISISKLADSLKDIITNSISNKKGLQNTGQLNSLNESCFFYGNSPNNNSEPAEFARGTDWNGICIYSVEQTLQILSVGQSYGINPSLHYRVNDGEGFTNWTRISDVDHIWENLHRYGGNYVPANPGENKSWNEKGIFISSYNSKVFQHQPNQWGQLINIPADKENESLQIWINQPDGAIYCRGGNGSIKVNDTPFKSVFTADTILAVSGSNQPSLNIHSVYENGDKSVIADLHTHSGVGAASHKLIDIINYLMEKSHSHTYEQKEVNCNCNCNCGDDTGGP